MAVPRACCAVWSKGNQRRTRAGFPAAGRNAGWKAEAAPIVMFLDGATALAPDFAADSLAEFEDPQIAVVWGHLREIDPHASIFCRVLDLDWICPPGRSDFCGGNMLVRRSVLEEVSGFDELLIAGEDRRCDDSMLALLAARCADWLCLCKGIGPLPWHRLTAVESQIGSQPGSRRSDDRAYVRGPGSLNHSPFPVPQ